MTEYQINTYRLRMLRDVIFNNDFLPWDQSILFVTYDGQLCIFIDGEYCQPNYGPYYENTPEDVESYRLRCNHLFHSFLLNNVTRQLKNSSSNTRLDMLIFVTSRNTIDSIKKTLTDGIVTEGVDGELTKITSHFIHGILQEDDSTRHMTVEGHTTIDFRQMDYETILPLEVIRNLPEIHDVWGVNTETGKSGYYGVTGSHGTSGSCSTTKMLEDLQDDLESLFDSTFNSCYYDYSMEGLLDEDILDWGVVEQPRTFPRTTEYEIPMMPIRAGPTIQIDKILKPCMTGI